MGPSLDGGEIITIIALGMGGLIALASIIAGSIRSAHQTRERELSRREIAAYIAEGSMSPQDGERLMNAGDRPKRST